MHRSNTPSRRHWFPTPIGVGTHVTIVSSYPSEQGFHCAVCVILTGMAIRTELTLRLENTPGALARLSETLAAEKINVLALNLESNGVLHLVTENPVHTAGLLRSKGYAVDECDVLYVTTPNRSGAMRATTRALRDAGVNVNYAFASAITEQNMAALVIGVDDAQRAATAAGM